MLLSGDDAAALLGRLADGAGIKGFDGVYVEHAGLHAPRLQPVVRLQRLAHHRARGDDGRIGTLPQRDGTADLEGKVLFVDGQEGSHTDVDGSRQLRRGSETALRLVGIGR